MRHSSFPLVAVVCFLAAGAARAGAQSTAQDATVHDPESRDGRPPARTCATLPAPIDTARTTVHANLAVQEYITSDGWKRRVELPPSALALVLEAIASRVEVHPPLAMPVFIAVGERAMPVVDGEFTFTLHGDGSVSHLRMLATTYAAQLDTSIVRAIELAAATHALVAIAGQPKDTVALRLTLGMDPDSTGASRPLFALRVPVQHLDYPAEARRHPPPAFPMVAWRNGVGGHVRVQFVVGTDGHAMPGTYRLLDTDYREIALAALNAIAKWEFAPATTGGCAIPQVIEEEFTYSVRWMP